MCDWQKFWLIDWWKDVELNFSDLAPFGCYKHFMLSRGARRGATLPPPLSPEPRERSFSSGESSHENERKLFGPEDSLALHTGIKGPPLPLCVNALMESQGR